MTDASLYSTQGAADSGTTSTDGNKTTLTLPTISTKLNIIHDKFEINAKSPIEALSSDFATAYPVKDLVESHDSELYALAFTKTLPVRMRIIHTLRNHMFSALSAPIETAVVTLTTRNAEEQFYVTIMEKPRGIPLRERISQFEGHIPDDFIIKSIIAPIARILTQLDDCGVAHGSLNLDSILIDDQNNIYLKECISEPSGYSQPSTFETIDRAVTLPIAKAEATIRHDLYAFGIIVLHLLNPKIFDGMPDDEIIMNKMTIGSYNSVRRKINTSPMFHDLLIGLLNDNKNDTWDILHLNNWLKGKSYNYSSPRPPLTARRSLTFLNRNHSNTKSLAYDLFLNWNEAKKFLREDTVARWIETSFDENSLAKQIRHVNKITSISKSHSHFDNNDELVARSILVLDPSGPLRAKNFAIDLQVLGQVLAYGYATDNSDYIQLTGVVLSSGLIDIWMSHRTKDADPAVGWLLDKASVYSTRAGLGFGMERCLYELNPLLTCQSPMVKKDYVLTLKLLLNSLENSSATLEDEDDPVDRHIAAFIAHRIKLTNEVRMRGLAKFPTFADNKHVQALALLALAQRKTNIKKLLHLSDHFHTQLLELANSLHSKEIKHTMRNDIIRTSKTGNLVHLLRQVSNTQHLARDKVGFKEAKKKYKKLYARKKMLKDNSLLENTGYRYGLQMAVIIAYLLCAVEILYLVAINM